MIVDDEPLAVKLLESFVAKTPDLELLGSYTDSVEAINAIREKRPQLLFLDIQMPDLNGMELAHMLPEGTKVIFTTAFKEYAFESYEVSALDFLLKPIRYNKFLAAVEKAKGFFSRNVEGGMWNENCSAMDLRLWYEGLRDVLPRRRAEGPDNAPDDESGGGHAAPTALHAREPLVYRGARQDPQGRP